MRLMSKSVRVVIHLDKKCNVSSSIWMTLIQHHSQRRSDRAPIPNLEWLPAPLAPSGPATMVQRGPFSALAADVKALSADIQKV